MLKPCAVVELVWQDETGSTAVTQLNTPSSLTVAEIDENATAFSSFLASLSGAVLVKQRIKYISVPDEPSVASGGTPITHTGLFFFSTGPTTADSSVSVPSLKPELVMSDGPGADVLIDLSNSDVIAFGDAVVASEMSNPFADLFVSLFAAYIQSRL